MQGIWTGMNRFAESDFVDKRALKSTIHRLGYKDFLLFALYLNISYLFDVSSLQISGQKSWNLLRFPWRVTHFSCPLRSFLRLCLGRNLLFNFKTAINARYWGEAKYFWKAKEKNWFTHYSSVLWSLPASLWLEATKLNHFPDTKGKCSIREHYFVFCYCYFCLLLHQIGMEGAQKIPCP